MNLKTALLNWLLLLILVALWGTSFLFISISVRTIDPITVVFARVLIGAMLLTVLVYVQGMRLPFTRQAWGSFLLMGAVGNVLPFFLITWGQLSISSGMAGMIMAIMPLITMLLAHYFVPGENLNRYKLIGFSLGLGGILMLLGPVFEGGGRAALGGIAVFLAATSYAINTILVRRLPGFTPLVGSAGVLIGASLVMLPFWLTFAPSVTSNIPQTSLYAMVWLGVGPTAIATLLLFAVIERAGPTFLSTINYMIPVVAFLSGALILSEPLQSSSILALLVILSGIAFTRCRADQDRVRGQAQR